ncbi:hypothetical protein EBR78_03005 [bacterium]|nr:hypothetical protein [bacterium]
MKKNIHFSVLFAITLSSWAFAGVFKFQLRGYPKLERNCHAQTEAVAALFEAGMQAKVLHVECLSEKQIGYDFNIEYEAPEALEFVSTDYSFVVTHSPGRYREQSECLKKLPEQAALFEQVTHLKPAFSYCRSMELSVGKNWEVILIAKGRSEQIPELGGYMFFSKPLEVTEEVLKAQMNQALKNQGAILADMIFHNNSVMGTNGASIHYFAPKRVEFHMERVSQVTQPDICFQQAREVRAFMADYGDQIFGIYCGDRNLGYFDLHLGFLNKPRFSWSWAVDTFSSWNECERNRSEVLKHYEGSAVEVLLGGVCSRNYQIEKYQVVLFRAKK